MSEQEPMSHLSSIEVCAGAGGQALGLERAGFSHQALVELDGWACKTLRDNRTWQVHEGDLAEFDVTPYKGVDLYAGGLPCPPFSVAGKQLGEKDERNLFGVAVRQISTCKPRAVMIENVRGILDPSFAEYRGWIVASLAKLGYQVFWLKVNAVEYGVPQLRPRVTLVALSPRDAKRFREPPVTPCKTTVGEVLFDLMASRGWPGATRWRERANKIAPTIVGGSKKHGGPDLGPTRARLAWAGLGVDGIAIAEEPPGPDFPMDGMPRLTVQMVARLQGFPDDWRFSGRKTHSYRQVGNAFPPPVAEAVATQIAAVLQGRRLNSHMRRSAATTLLL